MKKIVLALFSIIMIAIVLVGATVFAGAEATDIIPVPEVPAIDRPYKTIEELGIDFEEIDAYFPQQIEIRYEGGKVYIKDIGAGSVSISASDYRDLELVEGYWTADIEGELRLIYANSFEDYGEDRYWSAAYYGDGTRDPHLVVNDTIKGVYISFTSEYNNALVQYRSGDCYYEDQYSSGVLDTHGVSNPNDTDRVEAIYEVNGSLAYGKLYTNTHYYYFPGQGWSSTWGEFTAADTPEGYESIDETYFTANKPSLICSAASKDDMLHDMSTASCITPSTCKNGCGYTVGTAEHHDWQIVDGKKECSLCDAVFFPNFEFIDRTYNNLEGLGFPYDEIKAVFPEVLAVKYEDGKYMVKDVGADIAEAYNSVDYEDIELSLVDGWWIYELDEAIYNSDALITVSFYGTLDGAKWTMAYSNGDVEGGLRVESEDSSQRLVVYYDDDEWVEFAYFVGNRQYTDSYIDGRLSSQECAVYGDDREVIVRYLADGSFERACIYMDEDWYYYYPDGSWEKGVEVLLTPPAGYENADVAYFKSIIPTTINCAHESYSAADCTNPECCAVCGIVKEGSEPIGHNYVGQLTANSTCSSVGEMTYTCTHDSAHTYTEDVEIDENAHAWDAGVVTLAPTCSAVGHKTFTCAHDSTHTYTEDIDALGHTEGAVAGRSATCTETGLTNGTKCSVCGEVFTAQVEIAAIGHKYDNACDATCNTCGEVRTPAEHHSENADGKCDECGESFALSGGAIAGIVGGSAAALGGGGFSLWWFVFRKKRL